MLDVALLGTGGMMPLQNRYLTSALCRFNGSSLLIDCGEGTQVTLKTLGWGFKNIDFICFTHYHADHISGLPGLLLTMGNSCRDEDLTIFGPPGIGNVVKSLLVIAQDLPFNINIVELPYKKGMSNEVKAGQYLLHYMGVDHGIPCLAYSVEVKRGGKFEQEKAKEHNVPMKAWSRLQKYEDVEIDGKVYTPDMVLGPVRRSIKLSYCTDTRPLAGLSDFVRDSDLFICEGLYGENDKQEKAASHRHMIYSEAAAIARDGKVSELWLTHYSPAMVDPHEFIGNAKRIFNNSKTGYDRMKTVLNFID